MRVDREHPTPEELEEWDNRELAKYALQESAAMLEQKQTSVARLLKELAVRIDVR